MAHAKPFVALQFVSVLLHQEEYETAAAAAEDVVTALPLGARHDALRLQAQLTAVAAQAEAKVKAEESLGASVVLREAGSNLSKYVSHTHRDEPNAFIEAFSVAHGVVERLE